MNTDVLVERIDYFNKKSDERLAQESEWETISINDLKKGLISLWMKQKGFLIAVC